MEKPIFGMAGKAGTGKDTLGDAFVRRSGYAKVAFADPLRQTIASLLGVPLSRFDDRGWKEAPLPHFNGASPRTLMQSLGDWGRAQDPLFWVKLAHHRILVQAACPEVHGIVVTDIRYENEADMVRSLGGVIVHVERPGVAPVTAHSSENGIMARPGDRRWVNAGDLRAAEGAALGLAQAA